MDVIRLTVVDKRGAVSFIAHAEAVAALAAACASDPDTLEGLLAAADGYYHGLKDYVLFGLAVFDEHNVRGSYHAIHAALRICAPAEQPTFRVGDPITREASLRPVKAGVVLFNLKAKRIVQIQNSYRECSREGLGRIYDGERLTRRVFRYRLPSSWALVP